MKKVFLVPFIFMSLPILAQNKSATIQAENTSIIVNAGSNHLFSDNSTKRDLIFTLDGAGELHGEITIKDSKNSNLIFKGWMKKEFLIDSAMWYEAGKPIKTVHFRDNCCTNHGDYVEPTTKHLVTVKAEKQGVEKIYNSKNPDVLLAYNNYVLGKKHGKQFEYDSTGKLIALRNFKDGAQQDSSWVNCNHQVADIEIYDKGVPVGVWKKFDESGTLSQALHRFPEGDSTVTFDQAGKVSSVAFRSAPNEGLYTCREYDNNLTLRRKYNLKQKWDDKKEYYEGTYFEFDEKGKPLKVASYSIGKLYGSYEEYESGKIHLRGEYVYDEQVETWFTYNAKGKVVKTESFKNREEVIVPIPENTVINNNALAMDVFPAAINKPTISMTLSTNGKITKILKNFPDIIWGLDVKSPTDYAVVCTDNRLSDKDKKDVIDYLKSSIHSVKGVRYHHKEVPFYCHYKLMYK